MKPLDVFCRQVRARSDDHRRAFTLVYHAGILSQVMSILRQEIDSMIRVIYLLATSDLSYREELVEMSVNGKKWTAKGSARKITDREMVEPADKLTGWTESVYRFGCAFIHLSSFHDYQERDPMDAITEDEKEAILKHMRYYHGGSDSDHLTVNDLVPLLPMVFHKIAGNLECYLKDLEVGEILTSSNS